MPKQETRPRATPRVVLPPVADDLVLPNDPRLAGEDPNDGYDVDDDFGDEDDEEGEGEEGMVDFASTTRPVGRDIKIFESTFAPKEPYPFRLTAWAVDPDTGAQTGDTESHDFMARGNPGAGGVLALASLVRVDPHGRQLVDAAGMMVFFERVLIPVDWPRFYELIVERTDAQVEMEDLGAVYSWLIAEYGGRPTPPSSRSSSGRPRRGRSSTAKRR